MAAELPTQFTKPHDSRFYLPPIALPPPRYPSPFIEKDKNFYAHQPELEVLSNAEQTLLRRTAAISNRISCLGPLASQELREYKKILLELIQPLKKEKKSPRSPHSIASYVETESACIKTRARRELNRIIEENIYSTKIDTAVLEKAFPKKWEQILHKIERKAPRLITDLLLSGKTQKTIFCCGLERGYELKCRYRKSGIQVLLRKKIAQGGNKIIYKSALLSGPETPETPSRIFVYVKPLLSKIARETAIRRTSVEREIQTARLLILSGARNIAPIQSVYYWHHEYRIKGGVLDFYNLGDLSSVLRQTSKDKSLISKEQKFFTALQIALCLQDIHENGYIHGDIKPENILLAKTEDVIQTALCDFGSALHQNISLLTPIGTLTYTSPEIWEGKHSGWIVHPSVDMWSFGLVLLELFHGANKNFLSSHLTPNFAKATIDHQKACFEQWQQAIISHLNPESELDKLIGDLLSLNPLDRPSAEETAQRLEKILSDR